MRVAMAAAALLAAVAQPASAERARGGVVAAPIAQATAELIDRNGRPVGEATLVQRVAGVLLRAELHGLPPGWHAIHVHETGKCRPDFSAAGGHFNPTDALHGLNAGGPHAGDLPNFWVAPDGAARFEMISNRFALSDVARVASAMPAGDARPIPSLFDEDGAALVVHAEPDDYVSEPSGASGERIACGEIVRR